MTDRSRPAKPRFAVLDDPFRCVENRTGPHPDNLLWLDGVLSPVIDHIGGSHLRIASHTFAQRRVEAAPILAALELSPGVEAWAQILEMTDPAPLLPWLEPHFADIDIAVGFELPNVIFAALDALGVTVMDVTVSPIRFLSDLCLDVRSNDPALIQHLEALTIPDAAVLRAVTQLTATVRRKFIGVRAVAELGDAGVLIGQTPLDASLVRNGRIARLADYAEVLDDWAGQFDTVIVKPHPYGHGSVSIPKLPRGTRVLRTDTSPYQLFAYENVTGAVGLSSGCLTEAPWFGVAPTQFLIPPRWRHGVAAVQRVSSAAFTAPFWQGWLDGRDPDPDLPTLPSLREQLQSNWGYGVEISTPKFRRMRGAVR